MYPMPPISAARLYTRSMFRVATRQLSNLLRSRSSNSSATEASYSGCLMSTPRTQNPSDFRRRTRWWPMNPPAPVTRIRFALLIADSSLCDVFVARVPGLFLARAETARAGSESNRTVENSPVGDPLQIQSLGTDLRAPIAACAGAQLERFNGIRFAPLRARSTCSALGSVVIRGSV